MCVLATRCLGKEKTPCTPFSFAPSVSDPFVPVQARAPVRQEAGVGCQVRGLRLQAARRKGAPPDAEQEVAGDQAFEARFACVRRG